MATVLWVLILGEVPVLLPEKTVLSKLLASYCESIKIEIYEARNEDENRFSGLLLSDEVLVEERGYHVIDLSLELPLVREEDFVVVPGLS